MHCFHRMGKGGEGEKGIDREAPLSWEEVRKHHSPDDLWIVLEGKVYDVTEWKKRHPGGWMVIHGIYILACNP